MFAFASESVESFVSTESPQTWPEVARNARQQDQRCDATKPSIRRLAAARTMSDPAAMATTCHTRHSAMAIGKPPAGSKLSRVIPSSPAAKAP